MTVELTEQFRELRLPMFREHFASLAEKAAAGVAEPPRVSVGADGPGMPGSAGEPDRPPDAAVPAADLEDVEQLQVDATSAGQWPGRWKACATARSWIAARTCCCSANPVRGRAIASAHLGEQLVHRGRSMLVHNLQPAGARAA